MKCPNCGSENLTVFEMIHCQDCDTMFENDYDDRLYDDADTDWSDPDADDEFLGTFYLDVSSNLYYLSPGFPADPELLN